MNFIGASRRFLSGSRARSSSLYCLRPNRQTKPPLFPRVGDSQKASNRNRATGDQNYLDKLAEQL